MKFLSSAQRKGPILVFAREAGGARYLAHVLRRNRLLRRCVFWGEGAGKAALRSDGLEVRSPPRNASDLKRAFLKLSPSAVFLSATPGENREKVLLRLARQREIPVISALDHFWNLWQRFADPATGKRWQFLGDIVLAADDRITHRFLKLGGPVERLRVEKGPALILRKSSRPRPRGDQVLFISEVLLVQGKKPHQRFDQAIDSDYLRSVELILDALATLPASHRPTLLIRPHPAEKRDWKRLLHSRKGYVISRKGSGADALKKARIVFGMNSILLLEAISSGIPAFQLHGSGLSKGAGLLSEIEPRILRVSRKELPKVIRRYF